jgi:hypothetical protein
VPIGLLQGAADPVHPFDSRIQFLAEDGIKNVHVNRAPRYSSGPFKICLPRIPGGTFIQVGHEMVHASCYGAAPLDCAFIGNQYAGAHLRGGNGRVVACQTPADNEDIGLQHLAKLFNICFHSVSPLFPNFSPCLLQPIFSIVNYLLPNMP